jgi:MOSC domain-containing protein YiiM
MTVKFGEDGIVTITMTHDQLGSIRYALNEGQMRLGDTARYLRRMASTPEEASHAVNAARTAKDAKKANEALEAAVQKEAHS